MQSVGKKIVGCTGKALGYNRTRGCAASHACQQALKFAHLISNHLYMHTQKLIPTP